MEHSLPFSSDFIQTKKTGLLLGHTGFYFDRNIFALDLSAFE